MLLDKRVLFVDDHPIVLAGLAALLRESGATVTTARNLAEAAARLAAAGPDGGLDAVLLDVNLGGENGLDLLERLPADFSGRVVLLSGVAEREWLFHGFALGAAGFIPKNVEPEQVLAALTALLAAPADALPRVWDGEHHRLADAHEIFPRQTVLTAKEREVFLLLREGLLDKQIADRLGLSVHTVRVHLRAIKRKRGHNRRFEQFEQDF